MINTRVPKFNVVCLSLGLDFPKQAMGWFPLGLGWLTYSTSMHSRSINIRLISDFTFYSFNVLSTLYRICKWHCEYLILELLTERAYDFLLWGGVAMLTCFLWWRLPDVDVSRESPLQSFKSTEDTRTHTHTHTHTHTCTIITIKSRSLLCFTNVHQTILSYAIH